MAPSTGKQYGALPKPYFSKELMELIVTGEVVSLQHVLEPGIPVPGAHVPLTLAPYLHHGDPRSTFPSGGGFASEITIMGQHTGTHVDALAHYHRRSDGTDYLYGHQRVTDAETGYGIEELGVDKMPPIIGRGLLLDVAALLGVPSLEEGFEIGVDLLRRCEEARGSEVEEGDVVLLRTGYARHWRDKRRFLGQQPGIGLAGASYLADRGAVAIGSDTATVEVLPSELPVHEYLLVDAGVPLIECLELETLSALCRSPFVFIGLPLKIRGATGSVLNPIAVL